MARIGINVFKALKQKFFKQSYDKSKPVEEIKVNDSPKGRLTNWQRFFYVCGG